MYTEFLTDHGSLRVHMYVKKWAKIDKNLNYITFYLIFVGETADSKMILQIFALVKLVRVVKAKNLTLCIHICT